MIKLEIKWYWFTLTIIGILLFLFTLYHLNEKSRWNSELKISQLKAQIDSAEFKTNESVIEYRDRIIPSRTIVEKWNEKRDTVTQNDVDTLYLEAQTDINYLDTSLRKCDTALTNSLKLNETQKELTKTLVKENTKQKRVGTLKVIGAVLVGFAAENARQNLK